MSLVEMFKPKPVEPCATISEEMKKFYEVADALAKAGVYGEENTIMTCEILGIKECGNTAYKNN